ncbi:MAG: NYN domain-containing protein [Verrucomicrobia bacterium]|nr:NYN domain-containing protein [Verrucomicrobiota bacterium]
MSFLIDGYNFLFRIEGLKKGSLKKRRIHFIQILDQELSCFKASVFIIFDSSQQLHPYAQCAHYEHLDVLYSPKGQSADEYILELISISRTPKTLTVITSDTGLARQCHAMGAHTLSIEDFMLLVVRKGKKGICRPLCFQESPAEMERLLKEFEKRLRNIER